MTFLSKCIELHHKLSYMVLHRATSPPSVLLHLLTRTTDNNTELTLGCHAVGWSCWTTENKDINLGPVWLVGNQPTRTFGTTASCKGRPAAVTWGAESICHRERYWEITMPLHLVECKPCTISWTGSRGSRMFNDNQHLSAERTTLSKAGDVITKKRSSLKPNKADQTIFLMENMWNFAIMRYSVTDLVKCLAKCLAMVARSTWISVAY